MAKIKEYEPHEVAMLFPAMDGAAYEQMKADVAERGFVEKGTVHKGKLLDGRNRQRISLELGIEFPVVQYEGDPSPLSLFRFVVSKNLHRRHLNESQRAILAAKSKPLLERIRAENKERMKEGAKKGNAASKAGEAALPQGERDTSTNTRDVAAEIFNVSPRLVSDAVAVEQTDPDTAEAILSGEGTVTEARRKQQAAEKEAEKTTERREQNKQLARALPDSIKQLRNSPGILLGDSWFDLKRDEGLDRTKWKLGDRLDPAGGILVFRTMGSVMAMREAASLAQEWKLAIWPHQIDVGHGDNCEVLIVATKGDPDVSRLPIKPRRILCDDLHALVLSWFKPWAKEQGTPNLIAEFMGSKEHAGFQFHPWAPENAAA